MTSSNPQAETEGWGSWADAERWRAEEFAARSPAARLAWLDDLGRLASLAKSREIGRASSPAARTATGRP